MYLRVTDRGSKSWLFRFTFAKRAREMGLGPFPALSLAAARVAAQKCRESVVAGVDPIEARSAKRAAARISKAELITFKDCGEAYIEGPRKWKLSIKMASCVGSGVSAFRS